MTARTFDAVGIRSIVVDNLGRGSLSIHPGPRDDLVEGTVTADQKMLDQVGIRHEADTLRIWFPKPGLLGGATAHIRIGVPAGLALTVRAGSAEVTATVPLGRCRVASGSGEVSLSETQRDVEIRSGSGSVSLGRALGGDTQITSGSGDIVIGEALGPVSAKSGSGDLMVRTLRGASLRASSGSGDITVASTTGSVELRSASGSITVGIAERLAAWLDLSSTSGAVRVAVEGCQPPAPGEPYVTVRAQTASGEIAVYRAD